MGTACFLLDFEKKLELRGLGLCRACADDLGLVLAAIAHLTQLAGAMALMEDLAGRALTPAKCHIIPLACPVDDQLVLRLRNALIAIAPRFQ
eukprot:798385-Pyramimonas_sp.AAC.1